MRLGRVPTASNYHEIDALLALLSADRYVRGEATSVGDSVEGQIVL